MNLENTSPSAEGSRPSSSPRLVCRVVRPWCAVTGGGSRHVAGCADCRAYFQAMHALDHALRRDAVARADEAGAGSRALERDILRAVRQAADQPAAGRAHAWAGGWVAGAAGAVAAVAIAAVALNRETGRVGGETRVDPNLSREGAAMVASTVGTLSDGLVDRVIPTAGELVARNPMQQEIGSVYSDMRSALNFLAMNFLPSDGAPRPSRSSG